METAGRFDNSTCQICRLSRFYIPLNRELDAVWVGCLPLTKLYFAIWVECVPLNGKNIAVQGETPLRTAALPTAAGMLLAYNRTADSRRNAPCVQPHCRRPPEWPLRTIAQPTAAGMAHIRADKSHPRRQTTFAARRRMTRGSKKSG